MHSRSKRRMTAAKQKREPTGRSSVTPEPGRGDDARIATARARSTTRVGSSRHAYCPLCGVARTEIRANDVRDVEDALCSGRCTAAWHALAALRLWESVSERVAVRRRIEYESQQPHLPALSELLLQRWRTSDWTVAPEDVLLHVQSAEAASGAGGRASCASSG